MNPTHIKHNLIITNKRKNCIYLQKWKTADSNPNNPFSLEIPQLRQLSATGSRGSLLADSSLPHADDRSARLDRSLRDYYNLEERLADTEHGAISLIQLDYKDFVGLSIPDEDYGEHGLIPTDTEVMFMMIESGHIQKLHSVHVISHIIGTQCLA